MTKVISLSDMAYEEIKALKEADDSFSDVILKLVDKARKRSLLDFFGKWPGTGDEISHIKKEIEKDRKRLKTREVHF